MTGGTCATTARCVPGGRTADLETNAHPSRKYDFDTLTFCFGAEPIPT